MWRDILSVHTHIHNWNYMAQTNFTVCFNKQYSTKFFKINMLNDYLMLYGLYILQCTYFWIF